MIWILRINRPGYGEIQIAGVEIPDEFTGFYFKDVPLRIQARSKTWLQIFCLVWRYQ